MRLSVEPRQGGIPIWGMLAAGALVGGVVIAVLGLDHLPWTPCTFKALTGRPCLTCGTTRALGRLGALDVTGAWLMNPLATTALLVLLLWGALELALAARGRRLSLQVSGREVRIAWAVAAGLLVINWGYLIAAGR